MAQGGGVARVIVDSRFCVPDPVDLAMVRDKIEFKHGNFDIKDVKGNILFQSMTLHERWKVYRGVSTEECDFLYTVKKSKVVQFTTKLEVFLGHNNEEQICDFRVNVTKRFEHSCVVYAGESDNIVAQMQHKKHTRQTASSGLDNFSVTVNPNVDYAFVTSLLVLFDVINRQDPPGKGDTVRYGSTIYSDDKNKIVSKTLGVDSLIVNILDADLLFRRLYKTPEEKKEEMVQSVIVDRRFCVPGPVDLVMVRDKIASQYGNFVIGDVNGNMMFQVKKPGFGLHKKMILLDSSGSPVLTMKEKSMTLHNRWQVFKGGSTEECDMLYTVKRSSMIQRTTKLDVFFGQNNEEKTCDFRVKGTNWLERSCVVYAGVSDVIVAQMQHKKHTRHTALSGKDSFSVTVNPNVDYAFIASLVVLFDVIDRQESAKGIGTDNFEAAHVVHGLFQ
ncbi:unnamed protein product [Brassica napus]|uniref:(rape) hypothetical protein n=1 Tax=Brassica napus TaxID=3708 RepID=A0A816PMN2_BRANA|nr:unnamed protein product [Brassica napus]